MCSDRRVTANEAANPGLSSVKGKCRLNCCVGKTLKTKSRPFEAGIFKILGIIKREYH